MTSNAHTNVLLIGGGVACGNAALTLRSEGYSGSILLVGREKDAPYRRPPITKTYLQGRTSREDALVHPTDWWEREGVTLLTSTSVVSLDPSARTAILATKEVVTFDQALVATGAMVRRLDVPGAGLDGVHYLRVPGNADSLRDDLRDVADVVCVGGSYIASEVAASLMSLGHRVTMVMLEQEPLSRQFGQKVGRWVRRMLEDRGIQIVIDDEVSGIREHDGRTDAVVTKRGLRLPAAVVVCGVGAVPDVSLARKAGLTIGPLGGVSCDSHLRTSAEGIFAAGDICEYHSTVHDRNVRIEHENVAEAHGATAARNMLGMSQAHDEVPYFFSDLGDWATLEYVGPAYEWDEEIIDGDLETGEFSVWYLKRGAVQGMLSVSGHGDLDRARVLIQRREPLSRGDLVA